MDPALDTTLRAALAILFLAAAAHKVLDRGRFSATLADYHLLPAVQVPLGAGLVTGAEAAVAATLLVPALRVPALLGAAALLVVYGGAIAINLARGRRHIDCGCAGSAARRPISGWLVARNLGLAAACLTAFLPVHGRALLWVDGVTIACATAALAAVYASLDRMIADAPALARVRGEA